MQPNGCGDSTFHHIEVFIEVITGRLLDLQLMPLELLLIMLGLIKFGNKRDNPVSIKFMNTDVSSLGLS